MNSGGHVLLIDNHDSFVFNLAEAFERLGSRVDVYRNTLTARQAMELAVRQRSLIVLSPGPGRPDDAGCCLSLIAAARGRVPLLGVCLGHQAILQQAGAEVVNAGAIVHGKASQIRHDGRGLFAGVPSPLSVARYHSLCVRAVPPRFTVHARLDGMAMAVSDEAALQLAVQFHPESILTPAGDALLVNALRFAAANGHAANGHAANGHHANGHHANGHTANGNAGIGNAANGGPHDPSGEPS